MQVKGRDLRLRSFSVVDLLLGMIISMSFLLHLFLYTMSGMVYLTVFFFLVFLYVVSKPILLNRDTIIWAWIISSLVICFSYFHSSRARSTMIDVAVLTTGVLLLIFP